MTDIFIKIFNMSITASYLVMAIVILRLFLKKSPKWIRVLLWSFVGLRLIFPISVKSILSLIPSSEVISNDIVTGPSFNINSGINAIDSTVNNYISDNYFEGVTVPADNGRQAVNALAVIWIIGIALMLIYAAVSYIKIKIKLGESIILKENIWISDKIATPFILGVIMPKIYLPLSMNETDKEYVIAHEKAHLKRLDHLWKPIGFLLLSVYWFNPFLWIAYIFLCRDIELACDERVIRELGNQVKKPYSEALVNCSVSKRGMSACPLAFGENGVKNRIKSVLSYRKTGVIITAVSISIAIIVGICFLTNPETEKKPADDSSAVQSEPEESLPFKTSNNVAIVNNSFGYNEQGHPYVFMEIRNNNEQSNLIVTGQDFYILDGENVVDPSRKILIDAIKTTVKYHDYYDTYFNLQAYDLEDGKPYRIVANYKFEGYEDTYGIYVDFKLDSSKLNGTVLRSEVIYWGYGYKEENLEQAVPEFLLGDDNRLYTRQYNRKEHIIKEWYEVGDFEEFKLQNSHFGNISKGKWRVTGEGVDSIIKNNKTAVKYRLNDNGDYYYILRQNDGTVFLAEGKGNIKGNNRIIRMTDAISEPLSVIKVRLTAIPSKTALFEETYKSFDGETGIGKYLNGDHWTVSDRDNWAKLNPSNPAGHHCLTIQLSDTSYIHFNLFFNDRSDVAYAAFVKDKGAPMHYSSYKQEDYTRVILSDEFKEYIVDNILS